MNHWYVNRPWITFVLLQFTTLYTNFSIFDRISSHSSSDPLNQILLIPFLSMSNTSSNTIVFSIDKLRYERARTQSFHIITPQCLAPNIVILGSTGNEYILSISKTAISCNCPDTPVACKHVLFLLHTLRIILPTYTHVKISPSKIIPLLWNRPIHSRVKSVLLDHQANLMCSQPRYSPCYFCHECPKHSYGTIILCSKCGFLGHKTCVVASYQPGAKCPKCRRVFYALESKISNGYRNYLNILQHFDYITSSQRQVTFRSGSHSCRLRPFNRRLQQDLPVRPLDNVPLPVLSSAHLIPPLPSTNEPCDI